MKPGESSGEPALRVSTPPPEAPTPVCGICGTRLTSSNSTEFCPVCVLRSALEGELELQPRERDFERAVPPSSAHQFEHYELVTNEDGSPVELGRGGMGITYKAVDVNLGCFVTLKVINARYLDQQAVRLRFLREARAAARLRHPNVASVFHLGVKGADYFYAMEFVEGETLDRLIKRDGPLPTGVALEIVDQVAAGLGAAHKQQIIHRDIKPSNLMVAFDEHRRVTVKVIDFGLARAAISSELDPALSIPGVFAGTPHFASPEQCAGEETDIRSDLYSLGITLWQMLTAKLPFDGALAQIVDQHLRGRLPLQQLEHLQQPVVALLKSLLSKDPADRPGNPEELRVMVREVKGALEANRPVDLRSTSVAGDRAGGIQQALARDPGLSETSGHACGVLSEHWDFTSFLVAKLKGFTGRQWLFQEIDEWRAKGSQPALLIIGETGVGKSAIVAALVHENPRGQVLAYHCCRADTPATLEPAAFVRGLAAMFARRLSDYAALLQESALAHALQFADTDPASAFEGAILTPLHKIQWPANDRCYLLIDALDEALMRPKRPTIVDVLSTRLNLLPSWLCIVATTRSEPSVLGQLRSLRAHTLNAQDPRNQDDVRRFIERRLAEPILLAKAEAGNKPLRALIDGLMKSSAGNFLFVTTALDAVESGQLGFDQIEKLPPGLSSLYQIFFDRVFRDSGIDLGPLRQVLETLAAAREPLTRSQIAAATGLDAEEELPSSLSRLASFLTVCEGRYAFFHRSLFDWLTGWETQDDRPFAGPYYVSLKKGRARLADRCWTEYERGSSQASLYCLRHLAGHLHEVDRDQDLRHALLNFDFLQTKLDALDANALIADYEYLPDDPDLQRVQSAIRLSAHVLTRDRRQLAGQLTGRLLGNRASAIQALLRQAGERTRLPWLRPLRPTLTPPGGSLRRTLEGHTSVVTAVAVTPDGRRAVSASRDRTLRVWDLGSGQVVRTLEGHLKAVTAVALTPDGYGAVSASRDGTLRLWDLAGGHLMRTFEGHTERVTAVVVTRDGRRAVSASGDRTLQVWDLESGQPLCTLKGHTERVTAVAVTPDGSRAVSASDDRTLRVWDLENGQPMQTLAGHTNVVTAVATTPDGLRAVSASRDRTIRVWNLESGHIIRTLEGHANVVTAVAITPDGRRAVSASGDRTLRVWDLETGRVVRTLEGHTERVTAVAVTPGGRRAFSGSYDCTVRLWELESGHTTDPLEGHTERVTGIAVMPDGKRAISASYDRTLRTLDLQSGQTLARLEGHTKAVTAVAVTPDGHHAVSASWDRTLRLWALESRRPLGTLGGHAAVVTAVAITPDGRHAVSASWDRTLRLWDLEGMQTVRKLEGHTDGVAAVAVTPEGRHAVSASRDGTLRLWELASGETVGILQGHANVVTGVAITPDGRCVVSASADRSLRLWELASAQTLRVLAGHTDWVTSVTVTSDGALAVSTSRDGTLRVWDLESGAEIAGYTGERRMLACAVAPDRRTIISGDEFGRLHFLRLEAD
jgi:WD40 repeat protein/serine/threonine protein kinase